MLNNLIRGLIVSFFSAIIITFVVFNFGPLLPFNFFQGIWSLIFFGIAIILSFLVYNILPSESCQHFSSPNSQIVVTEDSDIKEKLE